MAMTYAEIAEKLTKKLGKFEKDIKSTEPDVRATAERTIPKIKEALSKLQQDNDISRQMEEAKEKQATLAKGGAIPSYADGGPTDEEGQRQFQNWANARAGKDVTGGSGWGDKSQALWDQYGEAYQSLHTPIDTDRKRSNTNKGSFIDDATSVNPMIRRGDERYFPNRRVKGVAPVVSDPQVISPLWDMYSKYTKGKDYENTPPAPPEEKKNDTLDNLYGAAQSAMITAPFGYDYGQTQYYTPEFNKGEQGAMGNLHNMEAQLRKAEALAMQDSSVKTKDQEMAIEKARQRNLKASQNLTGPARFAAQQMANANAKDNLMQVFGGRDRQEVMMNDPKKKAQLLAGMLPQYGSMSQLEMGIAGDRAQQGRYAQEHGLKTDAAVNALEMAKLSNMSKWAQMQKLMRNKENMDGKNFQAMMHMFGDPAVMEMYKNIMGE
jgi:hypothetical protein